MMKVAVLVGCLTLGMAVSASAETEAGARRLYDVSMRCFVANAHLRGEFKKTGDTANADRFDAKAKDAFDLTHFYGDMLHLSQPQIKRDIGTMSNAELPKLMRNGAYLTSVASTCKNLNLM